MSKQEIMVTRYCEMGDMISCYAIFNGADAKHRTSFDEAMSLR